MKMLENVSKIINEVAEIKREMMKLVEEMTAAVIKSGDGAKLVKLIVLAEDVIVAKRDITEMATVYVNEKMKETSCEMVEVNADWGPRYEECEAFERPMWFVEAATDNADAILSWKCDQLNEIRSRAYSQMAELEICAFRMGELKLIREAYKEIMR